MQGRRIMPNVDGWIDPNFQPGDYGRCTAPTVKPNSSLSWWQVCAPDGSHGCLDPKLHTIIEHEDGTITVTPSLDFSKRRLGAYHGFLKRGVWS